MLLAVTDVDGVAQIRQLRERVDVSKHGALGIGGLAARDVPEHPYFPVEVRRLLRAVSYTEARASVILPYWFGETPIAHERAQDELVLRHTEHLRLGDHDPVAYRYLSSLAPASRNTHKMVGREIHDCAAMSRPTPSALDCEVEELRRRSIVEPVDYPLWHDLAKLWIV